MTQYVLQINDNTLKLEKSYEVTEKNPIRPTWPDDRTQIVIEDTDLYNRIVAAYAADWHLKFHFNAETGDITWD